MLKLKIEILSVVLYTLITFILFACHCSHTFLCICSFLYIEFMLWLLLLVISNSSFFSTSSSISFMVLSSGCRCENNELQRAQLIYNRRWKEPRHIDLGLWIWNRTRWNRCCGRVVVKWFADLSMDSKRAESTKCNCKYMVLKIANSKTDLM